MAKSSEKDRRNWLDLPEDVTALILSRLDAVEILERCQRVCMMWRRICKHNPITWRRPIHIDFSIHNFGSHRRLLNYITDRSCRGIRRLSIVAASQMTPKELSEVASNLPLLRDLEISYWGHTSPPRLRHDTIMDRCDDMQSKMAYCTSSFGHLEVIGRSCPLLKSLKLNTYYREFFSPTGNGDAFAIAKTMPGLHHLQLFGNGLNNKGVDKILDCCRHLESLDLRQCFDFCRRKDWKRRCSEQLKTVRFPYDPIDDYEHLAIHERLDASHVLRNVRI